MGHPRIVITGSTRGLGLCMARELLKRGCAVMISGRAWSAVDSALELLKREVPDAAVFGFPCDTGTYQQVETLWNESVKSLGGVDHWINNAGIGQPTVPIWDLPPHDMEAIVRTDLLGILYGARVAMRGMRQEREQTRQEREQTRQEHRGAIWFMEGHGSDGRIMSGLSVYGAAKRALRYAANALAQEAKDTGVLIGTLSPGIMVTDFTLKQIDRTNLESWERTKKIFNILADKPETVAGFLVPRILAARKNGTHIAWLTGSKIMARFMFAGLLRRSVMED
jgi:NAD(P)-dependent dehydrogenase (short-subunit alcohol dehydrogenase family)